MRSRANLVEHPQDWPWCSLHLEQPILMNPWPIAKPRNWLDRVNQALTRAERESLDASLKKGAPFGSREWTQDTARRLGIEHTLRAPGRPQGSRNRPST